MGTNSSKKKLVPTSKLKEDSICPFCSKKIGKESTLNEVYDKVYTFLA